MQTVSHNIKKTIDNNDRRITFIYLHSSQRGNAVFPKHTWRTSEFAIASVYLYVVSIFMPAALRWWAKQ